MLLFFIFSFFFTVALLSAGAENFASIVAAREGRRESTVTMETSIPLTHTTDPLRTHSVGRGEGTEGLLKNKIKKKKKKRMAKQTAGGH